MAHFKQGEEDATSLLAEWHCRLYTLVPWPRIYSDSVYCAVPSLHGWISRAQLARFSIFQLGTIPIYTTKSKCTVLCHTVPFHAQLLV